MFALFAIGSFDGELACRSPAGRKNRLDVLGDHCHVCFVFGICIVIRAAREICCDGQVVVARRIQTKIQITLVVNNLWDRGRERLQLRFYIALLLLRCPFRKLEKHDMLKEIEDRQLERKK